MRIPTITSRRPTLRCLAALVCLCVGRPTVLRAQPKASPAPRKKLVVIVAKDSPVERLSTQELRSLFLGDNVKDPRDTRLVPLNQPPGAPDRVSFDRVVLGMSPDEAGRYWVDRKIRGEGRPPRTFDSAILLQRLVAKFPGAVAYVRIDQIDPAVGVKAVRIDGKGPNDPGYPLVD